MFGFLPCVTTDSRECRSQSCDGSRRCAGAGDRVETIAGARHVDGRSGVAAGARAGRRPPIAVMTDGVKDRQWIGSLPDRECARPSSRVAGPQSSTDITGIASGVCSPYRETELVGSLAHVRLLATSTHSTPRTGQRILTLRARNAQEATVACCGAAPCRWPVDIWTTLQAGRDHRIAWPQAAGVTRPTPTSRGPRTARSGLRSCAGPRYCSFTRYSRWRCREVAESSPRGLVTGVHPS